MGKGKLEKFNEMKSFENVFEPLYRDIKDSSFHLKGKWNREYFKNDNPIVLELGCGKGEYTVELAKKDPSKNYIGIDIKGARMFTGAKIALDENLPNVAFIRTKVELLNLFFEKGEISEIWVTFPDPQMKKVTKRLTSTRFLELYRSVMVDNGQMHLKCDSNFLYTYTKLLIEENKFKVLYNLDDIYSLDSYPDYLNIRTYYESQWLDRGITIKYLSWELNAVDMQEIDVEIEYDSYRSFGRVKRDTF